MAAEVRQFQVTTPPGTAIATPLTTSLAMPARVVVGLRVRIPPGPAGNMGFQLGMAGTPVIPVNVGQWIVGDDESFWWDLDGLPDSGAWQAFTYNLGILSHSVYLTFSLGLVQKQLAGGPITPLLVTA